jgi:hypothetical protein
MADAKATFALVGEDQTAAAFRSALDNVQTFSAQASEMLKGAFALGGAGIAVDFIKGLTEMGDGLVKGAQRAGIAQDNFNQLAAAFNEADISADSLGRGLKNLEVSVSKAAAGDQALASAFNEMGLSAASLKQLAPEVQLEAMAEAISRIADPEDRARLGAQTMGRAFLEMEPMLLKGAAGLDAIVKAANGMDAATTEKMARFNEQLNRTGSFWKGFAAFDLAGFYTFVDGLGKAFAPDLADRIARIKTALASPDNFDAATVERMQKQLAALQAQADALANKPATADVTAALGEQGKGKLEAIAAGLKEIDANWTEVTERWAKARSDQLDAEEKETRTAGERRVAFEAEVDDLENAHRISAREAIKRAFAGENAKGDANSLGMLSTENQKDIETSIQLVQQQWKDGFAAMSADSKLASENMRADFEKTKNNAQQAAQGMEDAFATFLVDPFSGGLKKMLASWIQTIDQMAAKAAAQSLFKSLFGGGDGLGGIFANFLSGQYGASTSVTYNGGGDPVPGALGQVPGYATGGSFNVGGSGGTDSQLVRFMATPGEKVTVSRPGQSAGGVTLHQTVNIDARTDAAQIGQLVKQSTAYAIQQSTAQIVNMVKRGRFTG